jgi:hypothetical protein
MKCRREISCVILVSVDRLIPTAFSARSMTHRRLARHASSLQRPPLLRGQLRRAPIDNAFKELQPPRCGRPRDLKAWSPSMFLAGPTEDDMRVPCMASIPHRGGSEITCVTTSRERTQKPRRQENVLCSLADLPVAAGNPLWAMPCDISPGTAGLAVIAFASFCPHSP